VTWQPSSPLNELRRTGSARLGASLRPAGPGAYNQIVRRLGGTIFQAVRSRQARGVPGTERRLPVLDEDQHAGEHLDELALGLVPMLVRRQRPAYPVCRRIKGAALR